MLIQNVALPQEEGRYDIAIENGVFTAIAPAGTLEAAGEVIDGHQRHRLSAICRAAYPSGYHADRRRTAVERKRHLV